jgi:hypothetical protein
MDRLNPALKIGFQQQLGKQNITTGIIAVDVAPLVEWSI